MAIWKQTNISSEQLNDICQNTMGEHIGIRFTEIGHDYLKAAMPVNAHTHQPLGLLHGGASAALAESVGSVAGWLCIDADTQICVGMEINCNHIRGKKSGMVEAVARPLHLGASSQVWDIRITDEASRLICISRLTVAVLKKTV
jgi:1,4-dihydroxy-2-naphthoyl-CoA hydrolase